MQTAKIILLKQLVVCSSRIIGVADYIMADARQQKAVEHPESTSLKLDVFFGNSNVQ